MNGVELFKNVLTHLLQVFDDSASLFGRLFLHFLKKKVNARKTALPKVACSTHAQSFDHCVLIQLDRLVTYAPIFKCSHNCAKYIGT